MKKRFFALFLACIMVLAALICVSTLFVKQHAILDVVSGLMLSLLAALPVYRRSPAFARR